MKNRIFTYCFVITILFSCQYVQKPIPNEKELLDKELKTINWKEVDEFPTYKHCDSLNEKQLRQNCFFESLALQIKSTLSDEHVQSILSDIKTDTLQVKVNLFKTGKIQFHIEDSVTAHQTELIKLDSILNLKAQEYPMATPATKRGVSVNTVFILPLYLR